jgi:cation transport ATPase
MGWTTIITNGHTVLWLAILADTGATLAVIANALRLLGTGRRDALRCGLP